MNYVAKIRFKKISKKIIRILGMGVPLILAIVLPVIIVFKYREKQYQDRQAKEVQDFLNRRGAYSSFANDVYNGESISDILAKTYKDDIPLLNNYAKEQEDLYVIPDNAYFVGDGNSDEGEIKPTPTPAPIVNDYVEVNGDILTFPDQFSITYYCCCSICCGEYSYEVTGVPNRTASGTIPQEGRTIAVCTDQIPLGTTVIIDGHAYVAEDVGGAITWNHIDIYVEDHQRALQLGRKNATVSIVR